MNSSTLADSHPAQNFTYILTDANLRVLQHSPHLENAAEHDSLVGMSLLTIVPELSHVQTTVQELLDGTLDYWESKAISDATREPQTQILKFSLIALRSATSSPQLIYIRQPLAPADQDPSLVVPLTLVVREIRTPLTYLRGYLEMLIDEDVGTLNAQQHEMMRVLMHSVLHLVQFSEQLILAAHPEPAAHNL